MNNSTAAPQSTFVTVLAYLLLAFNALGILGAIMQNVMINFVIPAIERSAARGAELPADAFAAMRVFALIVLVIVVFLTFAAYALLKRRNWARRTYIVLFGLGTAWSVIIFIGMLISVLFGADLFAMPPQGKAEMPPEFMVMFKGFFVVMSVVALAFGALYVWLIMKLRSPGIKAEFA